MSGLVTIRSMREAPKILIYKNMKKTYLAALEYFLISFGPVLNATSAVSPKVSEGFLSLMDKTWEHLTYKMRKCFIIIQIEAASSNY